jgi:hypothetical protein
MLGFSALAVWWLDRSDTTQLCHLSPAGTSSVSSSPTAHTSLKTSWSHRATGVTSTPCNLLCCASRNNWTEGLLTVLMLQPIMLHHLLSCRRINVKAWRRHEQLGHVRDVTFVAPIKGAFASWGIPHTQCYQSQRQVFSLQPQFNAGELLMRVHPPDAFFLALCQQPHTVAACVMVLMCTCCPHPTPPAGLPSTLVSTWCLRPARRWPTSRMVTASQVSSCM